MTFYKAGLFFQILFPELYAKNRQMCKLTCRIRLFVSLRYFQTYFNDSGNYLITFKATQNLKKKPRDSCFILFAIFESKEAPLAGNFIDIFETENNVKLYCTRNDSE